MTIDLLKGCYPYFSLIAVAVMLWRIRHKRWTRAETFVAVALLLHILLEVLQVVVAGGEWVIYRRYLLPVAPLFFVWTAHGLVELRDYYHLERHRKWLLLPVAALVLFLLYDGLQPSLRYYVSPKKIKDVQVLTEAGNWIRHDYRGPARDVSAEVKPDHYHSIYRPTVYSPFPALGEACGGRSGPWFFQDPPDYWVLADSEPAPAGFEAGHRVRTVQGTFVIYRRAHTEATGKEPGPGMDRP